MNNMTLLTNHVAHDYNTRLPVHYVSPKTKDDGSNATGTES
jgi:hypothetical protein